MKLFKKLAAAALAAVLALSMVGCGAGGTGSALDLKNEVLNAIEDSYNMNNKVATHTTAMDMAAATLIEKAAEAGAAEGNEDTVKDLLKNNGTGDTLRSLSPMPSCVRNLCSISTLWKWKAHLNLQSGTLQTLQTNGTTIILIRPLKSATL